MQCREQSRKARQARRRPSPHAGYRQAWGSLEKAAHLLRAARHGGVDFEAARLEAVADAAKQRLRRLLIQLVVLERLRGADVRAAEAFQQSPAEGWGARGGVGGSCRWRQGRWQRQWRQGSPVTARPAHDCSARRKHSLHVWRRIRRVRGSIAPRRGCGRWCVQSPGRDENARTSTAVERGAGLAALHAHHHHGWPPSTATWPAPVTGCGPSRLNRLLVQVGHLLGLGDRHLDNILLHRRGAHLVHIDFSVVFDRSEGWAALPKGRGRVFCDIGCCHQ